MIKKVTFYVDHCFAAGCDEYSRNLNGRYRFDLTLSDSEYEDLYEVWESHAEELNNWDTDWTGHEEWFCRINRAAIYAFQKVVEEHEPEKGPLMVPSLDTLWELSPETAKEF